MPDLDGTAATAEIAVVAPEVAVLVLSMFEDDDSVFAALRAGACGYLLKGVDQDDLLRAIRSVQRGEAFLKRAGTTIALGPINSIGRNVNNTIYVEDDFVSTNHAMLTFRGRSWFIEDQGSTN